MNYIDLYRGQRGACASCSHVRSYTQGDIHDGRTLLSYDGGKFATCALNGQTNIVMRDGPDSGLPTNICWSAK